MWRHKNASVRRLSSFPPFGVRKLAGRKKLVKEGIVELKFQYSDSQQVQLQGKKSLNWKTFSLDELKKATSDFSEGIFFYFYYFHSSHGTDEYCPFLAQLKFQHIKWMYVELGVSGTTQYI